VGTRPINTITARIRSGFNIVAAHDSQGYLAPEFELDYQYQVQSTTISPLYSASAVTDSTFVAEQQLTPPAHHVADTSTRPPKTQRVDGQGKYTKGGVRSVNQMPATEGTNVADTAAANKPKRVRTGCLTCRERHLKCDEGLPSCQNCRKSSRVCKRGVRLNFIDTTVRSPPTIPPTETWKGSHHPQRLLRYSC
jgi:hypothetical protein